MSEDHLKRENELLNKIVVLRERVENLEARLCKESSRSGSFRQLVVDMIENALARQNAGSDFARGEWYVYERWIDKAKLWLGRHVTDDKDFLEIIENIEKQQRRYQEAAREWNRIQALPKKEREKIMRRGIV